MTPSLPVYPVPSKVPAHHIVPATRDAFSPSAERIIIAHDSIRTAPYSITRVCTRNAPIEALDAAFRRNDASSDVADVDADGLIFVVRCRDDVESKRAVIREVLGSSMYGGP